MCSGIGLEDLGFMVTPHDGSWGNGVKCTRVGEANTVRDEKMDREPSVAKKVIIAYVICQWLRI